MQSLKHSFCVILEHAPTPLVLIPDKGQRHSTVTMQNKKDGHIAAVKITARNALQNDNSNPMSPETLIRFEQTLHCAYSGRHRPEDVAVFYLGALQAVEVATAIAPEAVHELAALAEVLADRATQATIQIDKLPWWKKIIRRV